MEADGEIPEGNGQGGRLMLEWIQAFPGWFQMMLIVLAIMVVHSILSTLIKEVSKIIRKSSW